ncbi:hypothetical protein GW17_00026648 [Ensete ventricosum]|nr:hypothetical protein GW17_00026648 [Ensete ventricosum]
MGSCLSLVGGSRLVDLRGRSFPLCEYILSLLSRLFDHRRLYQDRGDLLKVTSRWWQVMLLESSLSSDEDALPPETGSDQPAPPCAEPPTGDTSSRRLETATCLVSSGPAASVCGGGAGSTFPVRGDTGEVLPLLPLPPQLTGFLWPSNKSK